MMKQILGILLALGLTACSGVSHKGQTQSEQEGITGVSDGLLEDMPDSLEDSYAANPEVQAYIKRMVTEHGFDKAMLETAFSRIEQRPKVIEKSDNQPEQITPFYEYRKRFVSSDRIKGGLAFAKEQAVWLEKAQQEFGVDPSVIVALIGVETYYGRITGSRDVFTSLTTLAFDYPRRQDYFQSELTSYLLLARDKGWPIGATKGSYSGAMGMTQFMPSNYRKLAVDYDGNGDIDLWGSPADAIGSIANYLTHHGWQVNKPAFTTAQVIEPELVEALVNKGRAPTGSFAYWAELNVLPSAPFVDEKVGLLALRTAAEEVSYWLAYENFFTVMDYNPSRRYAMSVFQLAERIKNNDEG